MKLEYNIVGVAKNSEEDLRKIYDAMHTSVYTLALSVTRSRKLAREVAVETFKRVVRYAVTFDTDMDGQYWIADICAQLSRNSLKDPVVSASSITKEQVENASALLSDALFGLSGDRGTMVLLKATTDLKNADIASLCGYYTGSTGAEIRRGIANLAAKDENRTKKDILSQLKKDAADACPDYYDRITDSQNTLLSHVSHEAIYLSEEVNSFAGAEGEADNVDEREAKRKASARSVRIRVIAIVLGILLIGGIVAGILITASKNRNSTDEKNQNTNVQYGNTIDMAVMNGKLYYRGISGGIYSYDPADGSSKCIYGGTAHELVAGGGKLYFRGERSRMYSIDPDGSEPVLLYNGSGTTLCFANGKLYFSTANGICAIPADGLSEGDEPEAIYVEEVEDAPSRNRIVVADNGRVFFSGGADKGIYEVVRSGDNTDLLLLYFDEVYYMTLWDGKLLFDGLNGKNIEMYLLDTDAKKAAVIGYKYNVNDDGSLDYNSLSGTAALSYSAAYCTDGNRLWYEGCVSDENGNKNDIGIYVIGQNSDEPELVMPIAEDSLHITEMLSDGTNLYCFYSDGKTNGERKLISYDIKDFSVQRVIFDGRRE